MGLGVKGGFSPEKAHGPVPRDCELLSLGHTILVLRVLHTTPLGQAAESGGAWQDGC